MSSTVSSLASGNAGGSVRDDVIVPVVERFCMKVKRQNPCHGPAIFAQRGQACRFIT